jgi:hypothetical protein
MHLLVFYNDIFLGSLYPTPVRTPGTIIQALQYFSTESPPNLGRYHIVDELFYSSLIEKRVCLINHRDTKVFISQSPLHLLQSTSVSTLQTDENPQEPDEGLIRNVLVLLSDEIKSYRNLFSH